jgi:pimeloyl-ACP methyl ester carboxylesterase
MSDPGRYAEVNGLRMYYEIHGEGPPLLLLHGGTCSIERPPMGIPLFSEAFQVIAPEQTGHGRTADAIDRAFHYHDMAEDTVELMRQLEVPSASVIGLSDGAVIGKADRAGARAAVPGGAEHPPAPGGLSGGCPPEARSAPHGHLVRLRIPIAP